MDWVETTGKTVEEASQKALQHLGVGHSDADIEVLEEPKQGLFGRVRGEARVRARVRPVGPRPKRTRQRHPEGRRGSDKKTDNRKNDGGSSAETPKERPAKERAEKKPVEKKNPTTPKEGTVAEGISLAEQAQVAKSFLEGLLEAMEITATVSVNEIDAETVELAVNANPPTELGVLVGPKGTTLQALQEITRTVVQAKSPAKTDRILVDVAQYRERRVAALGRFALQVAEEVRSSGEERALEPMSPADRKAVHDALTEQADIVTRSEGEEPRRFVVIALA
jgi:spoIIIJ-associated protein